MEQTNEQDVPLGEDELELVIGGIRTLAPREKDLWWLMHQPTITVVGNPL